MNTTLSITQKDGLLKIENKSKYLVEIYLIPKKPKKKVEITRMIRPGEFFLTEDPNNLDISNLYFRFVEN
jgi:hypothetical protein